MDIAFAICSKCKLREANLDNDVSSKIRKIALKIFLRTILTLIFIYILANHTRSKMFYLRSNKNVTLVLSF